jgi:hypothetical protein
VEVVAVRAIGPEELFVEETLDAAAGANLIRISLGSDRPAHLSVPATPERHHGSTG